MTRRWATRLSQEGDNAKFNVLLLASPVGVYILQQAALAISEAHSKAIAKRRETEIATAVAVGRTIIAGCYRKSRDTALTGA
jgi:hypothetical protein